jgi:AcrR family transcriptional regulator
MARLTREETRALTRERLLDAAAEVFAARGFAGASLEEIADVAGFSRGAVYSNFAGKDELFSAVMARRREARYRVVAEVFKENPDPIAFFSALQERDRGRHDSRRWFVLNMEFFLYAMRNPEAQSALALHERVLREEIGEAIAEIFKKLGIDPPLPLPDSAAVVQALDYGLLLQHLIEPEAVSTKLYFDALTVLLDAARSNQSDALVDHIRTAQAR